MELAFIEALLHQCAEPSDPPSDNWIAFNAWMSVDDIEGVDNKILEVAKVIPKKYAEVISERIAILLERKGDFEFSMPGQYRHRLKNNEAVPRLFYEKLVSMPELYQVKNLPESGNGLLSSVLARIEDEKSKCQSATAVSNGEADLVSQFRYLWDGSDNRYVLLKASLLPGGYCAFDKLRYEPLYFEDLELNRILCQKMKEASVEEIEEY